MAVSVAPFVWYVDKAEEAAAFYCGAVPGSSIETVWRLPVESPSGPPGSVAVVTMRLAGQPFTIMGAQGATALTNAFSMVVTCDDQAEVDAVWDRLLDGGQPLACGWLQDRYGLCWQVTPKRLIELISGPDLERAKRVSHAMMTMVKFDIAALERA